MIRNKRSNIRNWAHDDKSARLTGLQILFFMVEHLHKPAAVERSVGKGGEYS